MSEIIKGWKGIAEFFGVSVRTARRRKKDLKDEGTIWYQWSGRPPRKIVCTTRGMLVSFAVKKGGF
jgi:transposase